MWLRVICGFLVLALPWVLLVTHIQGEKTVPLMLPERIWHDIMAKEVAMNLSGLNVILQLPLFNVTILEVNEQWQRRQQEYCKAAAITLKHPDVSSVHLLVDHPEQHQAIYKLFPAETHHKIRTFNIARRLTYADAVLYANRFLADRLVIVLNADIAISSATSWARVLRSNMRRRFYGLTRHEIPGLCSRM